MTDPTLRSDIPEERDQARAEAVLAYRERVAWMLCRVCGRVNPYDSQMRQFLEDCPRKPLPEDLAEKPK